MSLCRDEADYIFNDCCWLYHNGTKGFYNFTLPDQKNCFCVAPFTADPDIAGPGVLYAFIVTGWITCLVAAVAMYCTLSKLVYTYLEDSDGGRSISFDELVDEHTPPEVSPSYARAHPKFSAVLNWLSHSVRRVVAFVLARFTERHSSLEIFSAKALDVLCDIQIVTGTGILIAAIAQGGSMTFYHQQFVLNYWFICLNSFWAARSGEMSQSAGAGGADDDDDDDDDDSDGWHFWTRTTAILVSAVLSIYYQIVTIPRQWGPKGQWDPVKSGYCYIANDKSSYAQQFLWIAGLICYSAYLVFILVSGVVSITPAGPKLESRWKDFGDDLESKWKDIKSRAWSPAAHGRGSGTVNHVTNPRHGGYWLRWLLKKFLERITKFVWGFSKQFLALWAWGDIHSPFIVAAYFGFTAWNTYDLIDLKHSNTTLVPDETKWGFGQVLPLVLLGLVVLNLMDAAQEARKEKTMGETPSPASGHSLQDLQHPQNLPATETLSEGQV